MVSICGEIFISLQQTESEFAQRHRKNFDENFMYSENLKPKIRRNNAAETAKSERCEKR